MKLSGVVMRLDIIETVGAISTWRPGAGYRKEAGNRQIISFGVHPSERDHVDLKTGEIFQHPNYARLHQAQDKAIAGWLTCYRRSLTKDEEEASRISCIHYAKGHSDTLEPYDSQILMSYVLPDEDFDALRMHLLARSHPLSLSLDLEEDVLTFGWEPDGSGRKWDNETRPIIKILGIEFNFKFYEAPPQGALSDTEPDDRASLSDPAVVAKAVLSKLTSLEGKTKDIFWAIVVVGAIIIGLFVSRR